MSDNIKPQLALHLHLEEAKKKPKFVGHNYLVFEKHDGWYGYLDFPSCKIHSRAMREIPSLEELSNKIRASRPNVKGRLIFEIMIDGLEHDSFPELNGILNRKYEQVDDVYLRVHDFLPEWKFSMPAITRYEFATEIVSRINMSEVRVSKPLGISDTPEAWRDYAGNIWSNGGEGVIMKRVDAPYSPQKRNADILKIKEDLTLDLEVIGVYEGAGKYERMAGGIIVREKNKRTHRVAGMKDEQRLEWFKDPKLIVGKVVEVKAMKRLKDGGLREPRFKAIRYDKMLSEID